MLLAQVRRSCTIPLPSMKLTWVEIALFGESLFSVILVSPWDMQPELILEG